MKWNKSLFLKIGAAFAAGAILSLILYSQISSWREAVLTAYLNITLLLLPLLFVNRFVIAKLSVFPSNQQWLLKSIVYTIAICFAYFCGLLIQIIIFLPVHEIAGLMQEKFWAGFVALVSSSFQLNLSEVMVSEEMRGLILPFFAILLLITFVSLLISFVQIRWQESQQKETLARAELTALKAQIEPHFLFNALNTIAAMIRQDAVKAEGLLIQLSDMLRYMFERSGRETVELKQEILFTQKYIALLQARFADSLAISWKEKAKSTNLKVPVFLIQPLIENAIQHAWRNKESKLKITITIEESEDFVVLTVSDNGCGIHPEVLKRLPLPDHALANISHRLTLHYNRKDLLRIHSEIAQLTTVKILLPREES